MRSEAPTSLIGKVIRIVLAVGRRVNGVGSSDAGSNSKGTKGEFGGGTRLVATYDTLEESHRGIKKSEVHPAPRMSRSTCSSAPWGGSSWVIWVEVMGV
jgi:hypothetical protein